MVLAPVWWTTACPILFDYFRTWEEVPWAAKTVDEKHRERDCSPDQPLNHRRLQMLLLLQTLVVVEDNDYALPQEKDSLGGGMHSRDMFPEYHREDTSSWG